MFLPLSSLRKAAEVAEKCRNPSPPGGTEERRGFALVAQ